MTTRDEQEIRDYLDALESLYMKQGLAGTEIAKSDPRIMVLRWVLKRDDVFTHIEDILTEWKSAESQHFGSTRKIENQESVTA